MGFSRQECWSGLPFLPPVSLPNSETEPGSPAPQADSLPAEPQGKPIYLETELLKRWLSSNKTIGIGPNSIWLLFFQEKIGTYRETPGMCVGRGKTMRRHSKRVPSTKQQKKPQRKPTLLIPGSLTSSFQNYKRIRLFMPFSQLYFVMAALAN